jgi:hypothetical protein
MPVDYNLYKTQDVYLWEDLEGAFVRWDHNQEKWYVKFPHSNEYRVDPFANIVMNTVYADVRVTKQQYDYGYAVFRPYPRLPVRRF